MRNSECGINCRADICMRSAKPSKSFVHLFKGGGCPEGKALGRSPQRAKLLTLTVNSQLQWRNRYQTKKRNSHKKDKTENEKSFCKTIKCELRQFYPTKANYPRQKNAQSEAISILCRQRLNGGVIGMKKCCISAHTALKLQIHSLRSWIFASRIVYFRKKQWRNSLF